MPFAKFDKTLLYYYDFDRSQWNPIKIDNMIIRKLAGFYHSSTPTALTVEEEGWSPIRINSAGKLIVNTDSDISAILTKNTEIDTVLDLIKTAIDAIKIQTDKLTFSAQNNLKVQETAEV